MAYQILDIEGNVLETVESVQELFDGEQVQIFWDDEDLVARLKEGQTEGLEDVRIAKEIIE